LKRLLLGEDGGAGEALPMSKDYDIAHNQCEKVFDYYLAKYRRYERRVVGLGFGLESPTTTTCVSCRTVLEAFVASLVACRELIELAVILRSPLLLYI
jgi:hypothetical protein